MKPKLWLAGLIIITVTFLVAMAFIFTTARALKGGDTWITLPLLIVAAVIGLLGAIAFVVVAFSMYGLIDGAEPLGLPAGSVRALIALLILIIFSTMTVFFVGVLKDPNVNAAAQDLAKQVLTVLGTLLTAISSFYFGSQSATAAATKVAAAGNAGNPSPPPPPPPPPGGGGGAAGPQPPPPPPPGGGGEEAPGFEQPAPAAPRATGKGVRPHPMAGDQEAR
jgi:hypothetical protein